MNSGDYMGKYAYRCRCLIASGTLGQFGGDKNTNGVCYELLVRTFFLVSRKISNKFETPDRALSRLQLDSSQEIESSV